MSNLDCTGIKVFALLGPVFCLSPNIEGHILVLDHMPDKEKKIRQEECRGTRDALNLSSHGEGKENEEIYNENGPIYRNVEDF